MLYGQHGNFNRERGFSLRLNTNKTTFDIKIFQGRKTSYLYNALIFNDFLSIQASGDLKNL